MHPLNPSPAISVHPVVDSCLCSGCGREILSRNILAQQVIMYRTEEGEAVVLAGVCPHRSFLLAQGLLVGDAVQCLYNGFTFDQKGTCVRVPSQTTSPSKSDFAPLSSLRAWRA